MGCDVIRPGEVYFADPPGQWGRRPVIVVSREELNRGTSVVIVPCTTVNVGRRSGLPNYVFFRAGEFGFTADCVAQCEGIQTLYVSFIELDAGPIGTLDDLRHRDVIRAIGNVIGSDCEPV